MRETFRVALAIAFGALALISFNACEKEDSGSQAPVEGMHSGEVEKNIPPADVLTPKTPEQKDPEQYTKEQEEAQEMQQRSEEKENL